MADTQVPMFESNGAELSGDEIYRFRLWRIWDGFKPFMVWVMLNPSTANALEDDATIRRCIGFAKLWGYGGIVVVNLFALRSTDPTKLLSAPDPVGRPRGANVIYEVIDQKPGLIVAAWGGNVPVGHDIHVNAVKNALRSNGAKCLGHTLAGEPKHPVRLAYETRLVPL